MRNGHTCINMATQLHTGFFSMYTRNGNRNWTCGMIVSKGKGKGVYKVHVCQVYLRGHCFVGCQQE